jgi:hypothetical protein
MLALAMPRLVVRAGAGANRFAGVHPNLVLGGSGIRLRRHKVIIALFFDLGECCDCQAPLLSDFDAACDPIGNNHFVFHVVQCTDTARLCQE